MERLKIKSFLFFVFLLVTISCGGGGGSSSVDESSADENNGPSVPSGDVVPSGDDSSGGSTLGSEIAGVWDYSEGNTDDEWYLLINQDGFFTDFDFEGDAIGTGDNCYTIDRDWGQLVKSGANYSYTYLYDGIEYEAVLVDVTLNNGITLTALETTEDWNAGEIVEAATIAINPPSVSDMNALDCDR